MNLYSSEIETIEDMVDFSWVLGHAKTTFVHHPKTVTLRSKKGDTRQSLAQICKAATPPCHLNPLLFNGHLQTFWTVMKDQRVPVYYKRQIFEADDSAYSGTFAVDFVVHPYEGSDETLPPRTTYFTEEAFPNIGSEDSTPMLVCLHGLSGGSHELYLRHVVDPIFKAGWEVCVVNSRGCANSKITSGVLYNARATWDVRQMVKWMRRTFPNRPLFGIGFSLGANIMANYLGEEGENCLLKAAVVCSNPWNLEAGSLALQRTWLGLEVYSKIMGTNMKELFKTHEEEIAKNPRVDVERVRKIKYLHEFDRELQGPTWGYPTEGAYYRDASSADSLLAIRIPLLSIHAEDDPIAVKEAIPVEEFKKNPFAVSCQTTLGGHLSWFEIGGSRWFVKPVVNFLTKLADDFDLDNIEFAPGGELPKEEQNGPSFVPMRRKLQVQ